MTKAGNSDDAATSPETTPSRRSRWQRFSPSMGWRAFWSEILIVVLGVAIALAAGEVLENWNWRNKVAEGRIRLQGDVDNLFRRAAEQYAATPCVEAQLETLTRNLIESGNTLTPAPVLSDAFSSRFILRMPTRVRAFPVWGTLVANGTATHFSDDWQNIYNGLSSGGVFLERTMDTSRDLQVRLMAMTHPIALDPQVRRDFLLDLEALRTRNANLQLYSSQTMIGIAEAEIAPKPEAVDAYLKESATVMFCKKHGLPLASWRDFRKARPNNPTPNPVKAP